MGLTRDGSFIKTPLLARRLTLLRANAFANLKERSWHIGRPDGLTATAW